MEVLPFNRTLEQELLALSRGVSLECLVCGEFVLRQGGDLTCLECGSVLHAEGVAAGRLDADARAG